MAIKGGDLIHVGNKVLIDRAQTAGPGDVTINREKIYELGNYFSLASVLDTPDMSFSLESYDVSAEFEATLLNLGFTVAGGTQTAKITGSPTGGDFTLTYNAQTTTAIAYNASPAVVQTALEALSSVAPGDLYVSGSAGSTYVVAFTGNAGTVAYTPVTAIASLTGGTTPAITMTMAEGVGMPNGTALDPAKYKPMDIASAFKPGFTAVNSYDVVGSVAIPYLALESLSYKFGFADIATQSATLKGDSIYYAPGTTFVEEFAGTNTVNQAILVTNQAIVYRGDTTSGPRYALSVSLASGKRLLLGADYTEAAVAGTGTGFVLTVTVKAAVAITDAVRITYSSDLAATYPQLSHAPVTPVRPAAIKGRNVEIFIGGTAVSNRWTSVQSVNIDWKVTLEKDEELGNANFVSQSFDTPDVTGSVELKPRDYLELYTKICQIAGVAPGEVAGPLTTSPLELLVVLHSPDTGAILKSIEVPDARFTLPGYSGQAGVGQKINVTFNWESDTGAMIVWKGAKP